MELITNYDKRYKYPFFVKAILFSFFTGIVFYILGASLLSFFAVLLTTYFLILFVNALGNNIPIIEIMLLLCVLQWLLGPVLAYAGYNNHYKYYMYITEKEYFPFVILGILAFFTGSILVRNKREKYLKPVYLEKITNHLKSSPYLGYSFILFGWVCSLIQRFMPGSLNFIFFLLANSMYIGVIYLLLQPSRLKWWVTGSVLFLLFLSSLQSSMFHGLLLWLTFISLYFFSIKKYSFQRKLLFIFLGIGFAYIIQIAKWEIRNGTAQGNLSGFVTVINDKVLGEDDYDDTETATQDFVVRLNQGWIISRIMYYIPVEAPFVDGKTVKDAISSTLLPRFLNPGKAVVGGKEYFELFTGFVLLSSTSMGASLLGEGYANFGYTGAIVFMFVIGLFYRFALNTIYKIADKYPTVILWIPLIFLQVVKAESDLLRVLNHLVKASLLVFLIYWVCYKVFKWRI